MLGDGPVREIVGGIPSADRGWSTLREATAQHFIPRPGGPRIYLDQLPERPRESPQCHDF